MIGREGPAMSEACPLAAQHTEGPSGCIARQRWAARLAKTHRQVHCGGCGLLAVWIPRPLVRR